MRHLRNTLLWVIGLVFIAPMIAPSAPVSAQAGWYAEYFNNPSLSGAPVHTAYVADPSVNWGYGSPSAAVPPDNFSVRWTVTTYLNGGNYQIQVYADDGVRVLIDGIAYINRWTPATGRYDEATIALPAGNHTFVVEYYEAYEVAQLSWSFTQTGSSPSPSTGPVAVVTANALNLRDQPNPYSGNVIGRIAKGQTYPIIARTADSSWLQLNVNSTLGWVNASYVHANDLGGVPVVNTTSPLATVNTGLLNVRETPNPFNGRVIAQIRNGQAYNVVGRNADTSWLQLSVNGMTGWVNARYVNAPGAAQVPVTHSGTNPSVPAPTINASVTAYYLHVRSGPGAWFESQTVISRGQSFQVVGQNAAGTWLQLNVNGRLGWVNRSWVSLSNVGNIPITG
jgi:uncharacterized protein YraI